MPPAGKIEERIRQKKAAKQKKILIFLAPVLLLMLAWQGPGMLKVFSSPKPPPAAPVATSTTPETGDPAAAAAPSTAGVDPAATPVPAGGPLPDSDDPLSADPGQLVTFDRFASKDPFRQQVSAKPPASDPVPPADDGKDDGGSGGQPPVITPPDDDGGGNNPPGTDDLIATIDVNGTPETVAVDAPFPVADPIFRLVSLTARSAKIGLVTGQYSTGSQTVVVKVGKSVTLVSQPDGVRYRITLVRVS